MKSKRSESIASPEISIYITYRMSRQCTDTSKYHWKENLFIHRMTKVRKKTKTLTFLWKRKNIFGG